MRVIVLGANGQLGGEVVRHVAARGHKATAFVRRPPNGLLDKTVEIRLGDARKREDLIAALPGHEVVINAIGSGSLRKSDVESSTTAVAVATAQQLGISRYIAMSAGMVALDWPLFNYLLRPLIFRNIMAEHLRIEEIVKASALRWTIVRPPKLTNGPPRGYVASLELQQRSFSVARADVAAFIADELESNKYVRQAVFVASRRDK
jgi:uncharacterized protein YbjT (DUF2867 family)